MSRKKDSITPDGSSIYVGMKNLRNLDGRWHDYIRFNKQKVCIEPNTSKRDYIINKYKLKQHDTDRKRRELAEAPRTAV